ncbi:hypothetical protein [Flavobacterium gawalongense]|uniref:Lipoprotein n=1 Tax=Flavobacterium gawalongense TaxID=2594432 RepID=A0A553BIY0_9FLAO|nr:hypothetical protein [Flavobacterium gawalongense]TRX08197.1 hypothetical protein FNW11_11820 [Flavobacterium gawalongense]TRX08771.1 hypothetical protein FNW10_12335 [Flavobacterium gawalongense]TRX24699.1 hypothetical protein FNW38_12890 [Flavobacterium gawalongense]
MKKITLLLSLFVLVSSCGVKQTQNLLSSGNYDQAIENAVSNLRTNKDKKGKQDYVYLLEEAFAKAKERDLNTINLLAKDANPAQLEKMYTTYIQLNERQEKIKPLLPLKLIKEGRNAIFPFDNYNDQIIDSKNALSAYLYANSKKLMATSDKMNFRKAYDDLDYLNQINPNYKNVLQLIDEAKFKGSDYVSVYTKNETRMIIPVRLQNDLLDFSTYGLNDKWTVYHSDKQRGIDYDYGMMINFRQIYISPEQIKEREFVKERIIKDGVKKLIDANGKEVLDEKGKVVMVDNLRTVNARIYEFRQFKSCQITAKIDYINLKSNQLIQSFPLTSEFVFENIYATYKGDRRASDDNYYSYFDKRAVAFPSSEQMVYDTGEDLKAKLKDIISRNRFRN